MNWTSIKAKSLKQSCKQYLSGEMANSLLVHVHWHTDENGVCAPSEKWRDSLGSPPDINETMSYIAQETINGVREAFLFLNHWF